MKLFKSLSNISLLLLFVFLAPILWAFFVSRLPNNLSGLEDLALYVALVISGLIALVPALITLLILKLIKKLPQETGKEVLIFFILYVIFSFLIFYFGSRL